MRRIGISGARDACDIDNSDVYCGTIALIPLNACQTKERKTINVDEDRDEPSISTESREGERFGGTCRSSPRGYGEM